jgi:hypothetical protein
VTLERHSPDGAWWSVTWTLPYAPDLPDFTYQLVLTRAGRWELLQELLQALLPQGGRCRDLADTALPADTAIQAAWLALAAQRVPARRHGGGDAA